METPRQNIASGLIEYINYDKFKPKPKLKNIP